MSVRFGPLHLDTENACVWCGSEALHLTPKAFAVLNILLAHPGRLVTKDELWQAVWPGIAVTDAALTVCIREIRQRLHDDARAPRVIETVHRRGYRLIAQTTPDTQTIMAATASPDWRTGPLVGRDSELARLHEHLARAAGGERRFVLVTGEAGIGKTRVVDAFLAQVVETGAADIARGLCIEYHGSGEPYLPVLDAIGRLCRGPQAQHTLAVLGQYAPTWLVEMPGVASAKAPDVPQPAVLGATHDRMLREMADALEALTADRPLVLVLEDLHWSDHATLDLIAWLARRREPARLLLLGTYRPVDVIVRAHPLRAVAGELVLHGLSVEMPLELLSEEDVAAYLALRLPGGQVSEGLVRAIYQRTDGNPLFVVAAVDALVQQGWLAVAGARFVHALYQHAVYERLSPGRCAELHRRIGARAEAAYRERAGERAAELARHFHEGREAPRAVAYLRQAAENALQRSAYHVSAAHLQQGLSVLQELPHTPERDRDELAFRITLGRLLMSTKGFASSEVGQTFTRARALCHELGERSLLIRATWGLSVHHLVRGQPRRAHELAEELRRLIEDEPGAPLLPIAHVTLGFAFYYLGELPLAGENFREGIAAYTSEQHRLLALYGPPQDPRVTCLCYGAWVAWTLGFPDRALAACRAATDLALESPDSPRLAAALVFTARLHQFRREAEQTRRHAEAAMKLAREQGFTQRLAAATILFGWARAVQGAPEGIETMSRGLADYRATGAEDDLPYWLALLAGRRAATRQVEAAWRDLDEALALVRANGTLVWEAELHRLRGVLLGRRAPAGAASTDEATTAFETALTIARRQQARAFELRAATSLARWRREHGRRAEARALLETVRAWFTEGFDTPDLIVADALLRELGADAMEPDGIRAEGATAAFSGMR